MKVFLEVKLDWRDGQWFWDIYIVVPKPLKGEYQVMREVFTAKHGFQDDNVFYRRVMESYPVGQLPPKEELQKKASEIVAQIEREIRSLLREIQEKGFETQ